MAFTPHLIGRVTFSGVTSASLAIPSTIAIGTKILVVVCINAGDWDDLLDTQSTDVSGNVYNQKSASVSPHGTAGAWFVSCDATTVALTSADSIVLTRAAGMTGSLAAFSVTGLTAGTMDAGSAGAGTSTTPVVALSGVPANDYVVGVVGVDGPSGDGFTQDPAFTSPGNFNTQTTTGFSTYAGFLHFTAGGDIKYQPTLGVSRDWVALLLALKP